MIIKIMNIIDQEYVGKVLKTLCEVNAKNREFALPG